MNARVIRSTFDTLVALIVRVKRKEGDKRKRDNRGRDLATDLSLRARNSAVYIYSTSLLLYTVSVYLPESSQLLKNHFRLMYVAARRQD